MRSKLQECPVCGNSLLVNPYSKGFRCKWCKKPIYVKAYKVKGRTYANLEEALDVAEWERTIQAHYIGGR